MADPRWNEHTVVANLPRRLKPSSDVGHVAFTEAEEPRTVVGSAPSPEAARELLARYMAATTPAAPADSTAEPPGDVTPEGVALPARIARLVGDDFRRAPRIARVLLPALPLIAAVTIFMDDAGPTAPPSAPLPRTAASSAAATTTTATAVPAAPVPAAPVPAAPPAFAPAARRHVTIPRQAGRTLAAEAADAAARGDRAAAANAYAELAAQQPGQASFASAARILRRQLERDRPASVTSRRHGSEP